MSLLNVSTKCLFHKRFLFGILRVAFNTVDRSRLREVGPDRLCAEWIVKNGGIVRFDNHGPVKDYNSLMGKDQQLKICEVDASAATIMAIGFDHFRNCNKIEKIILHKCKHMENEALDKLIFVNDSLKALRISECYNVTDSGLLSLSQLKNLKQLFLNDLPYVQNLHSVVEQLQKEIPNCHIKLGNPVETN